MINVDGPSLESAADDGFYVASVTAESGVDGDFPQVLFKFLLASNAFQPHQLPVVLRVPTCDITGNSIL